MGFESSSLMMAVGTMLALEYIMMVVRPRVGKWLGMCSGSHMWMGTLSMLASDNNAMDVTGGVGTDAGGRLIGMGTEGSLPRKIWQSVVMASSLLGGASWTPAMASLSCHVAAMILSVE